MASKALHKELGLDKPLPQRYVHWLGRALHGDLGHSYATNQSVVGAIGERLPLTLELMLLSELLALAIAIPLGVGAARRPGGFFDRLSGGMLFALLAFPAFMLGVLLIYVFAVQLRWLPATGEATWFHLGQGVVATPISILLPIITLTAGQLAVFARLLRSEMLITLRSEYILVAKAKGHLRTPRALQARAAPIQLLPRDRGRHQHRRPRRRSDHRRAHVRPARHGPAARDIDLQA